MIDEVLEFIITPILLIGVYCLLIFMNYYTMNNKTNLNVFKSIAWFIATPLIFVAVLTASTQVSTSVTFIYVALILLFMQLFINIEFLLEEKENVQKRKKYN